MISCSHFTQISFGFKFLLDPYVVVLQLRYISKLHKEGLHQKASSGHCQQLGEIRMIWASKLWADNPCVKSHIVHEEFPSALLVCPSFMRDTLNTETLIYLCFKLTAYCVSQKSWTIVYLFLTLLMHLKLHILDLPTRVSLPSVFGDPQLVPKQTFGPGSKDKVSFSRDLLRQGPPAKPIYEGAIKLYQPQKESNQSKLFKKYTPGLFPLHLRASVHMNFLNNQLLGCWPEDQSSNLGNGLVVDMFHSFNSSFVEVSHLRFLYSLLPSVLSISHICDILPLSSLYIVWSSSQEGPVLIISLSKIVRFCPVAVFVIRSTQHTREGLIWTKRTRRCLEDEGKIILVLC
ncbi:hypothetical protein VP01_4011g1 [Puccinia sorghi]|uniref:Uncharacterized protein n=1 Tax=Puccinia sorghi TaxID=27349 RepID=A0A0L6UTS7_9BASI|nr:hypothetical protein VP01_4011g1 [Puccinia sorghi]